MFTLNVNNKLLTNKALLVTQEIPILKKNYYSKLSRIKVAPYNSIVYAFFLK